MQLKYHQRLFWLLIPTGRWHVVAGRSGSWRALVLLLTCSELVLVKASFGAQFGPSHAHSVLAQVATNCGSFVVPNRLPRANHIGLHQSPSQEAQNQHTQWPASKNIRAGSISFTCGISKRRSWQAPSPAEANSTSCSQHLHRSSHTVVWD